MQDERIKEIWKWIPGYEGRYKASNYGRVKSFCRYREGKILSLNRVSNGGYPLYSLWNKKGPDMRTAHRLCIKLFGPPRPTAKHEVAHNDGNAKNNCISNLRWATRSENIDDRRRHGTHVFGERVGSAKTNAETVLEIRKEYKRTGPKRSNIVSVAKKFNLGVKQTLMIAQKKAWKHV